MLDDVEIAGGQSLAVTHGNFRQELARRGVADGGVVFQRGHALVDRSVVRGDPADAQTCQSVGFGCDTQRDGVVAIVTSGGQTRGRVVFRFAVDLVRKQEQVVLLHEAVEFVKVRAGHEITRRVVRRVDDDGLRRWAHERREFVEIERPVVFLARQPRADVTADALRHFRQRLVIRRVDDDVVVLFEHGVHEEIDRLPRARVDEHMFRLDGCVEIADLRPQGGTALRLGVSQPDGIGISPPRQVRRPASPRWTWLHSPRNTAGIRC